MPLMKNTAGRIVAVSASRVKPLMREGFTMATAEEIEAWQRRNGSWGKERVATELAFTLPEGYRATLDDALTKSQLVAFALEHFELEISESMNKGPMLDAILDAALQSETAPLPE